MSAGQDVDFIVVGAGMAGASAAASLAAHGRVVVLEAEPLVGYHSTGRSAAVFSEIYGNAVIRALTRASRAVFFDPPIAFAAAAIVRPRPTLYFATADQLDLLQAFHRHADVGNSIVEISPAEVRERVPAFREGYVAAAVLESGSADIDVDVLHQAFLRLARARGAQVRVAMPVQSLVRIDDGRWRVESGGEAFTAPVVLNAAGAWGDEVARRAGVQPMGLQPMRRTALLIAPPGGVNSDDWPTCIAVDEQFYFKPDAGRLLLSPADEHPSQPCDAQPEELDVALAVDRFEQATGASVRRVEHRWAGLRVFAPDRTPVVGFDPNASGFFWLVGQGGYGIQTAPALGRVAAALARGVELPDDIRRAGVDAATLSPDRFLPRTAAAVSASQPGATT